MKIVYDHFVNSAIVAFDLPDFVLKKKKIEIRKQERI